jgi:hypothetical protein
MNRYLKILGLAAVLLWSGAASAQQANSYWFTGTPGQLCPSCWIPVSSSNPPPQSIAQGGHTATVSVDGALTVATPAFPEFSDAFSAALDTTTNWTTNNSGGTTATSAGSLVVSGTTVASQYAGLSTKQSWAPTGGGAQLFGVSASFNTLVVTNSVRIFGVYTSPGTPTLAAPITDGYVYRLDATGNLFAEVWAAGTAVSSTNITAVTGCTPTAGVPNAYYVSFRSNLVQFGCGANPAAATVFSNPVNQTLPVSAYSIAGLSAPGSAATMSLGSLILATNTPAAIKTASQIPTINDPSMVVSISPNSPAITTSAPTSQYPSGAVPLTATATGTTAATVATLAGTAGKTTFICGFTISADATTAIAGAATVTGTISGSLNYIQNVGAATAAGVLTQTFNPCIPASAANTAIAITSAAAGIAGNTSVNGWGYQL